MTSERWQQVKHVLDRALSVDPAGRAAYLESACAGDDELRREVDSLLACDVPVGFHLLDTPAVESPPSEDSSSPAGRRLGAYELVEIIGRGGMGEVYRARRADGQYQQEVAIKVIRGGYEQARSLLERFRTERQILARLEHPNIARLLDGGSTDSGIPFLVMELVEGTAIQPYCDAHDLSVPERLELFRQVCSAVQYAHQRLVVHRDIKPTNILVTAQGAPKLLDFGIARIVDPQARVEATRLGPLTPEYASPEQVRGEPVTTATDIYSLGVVLYQLLTGRLPYDADTSAPATLARAITDDEPPRPSTLVGTSRRLHADLDAIVLKALRKEPEQRYVSADQLSEDIRCHLQGQPVAAVRGTWSYLAGKFVRRHKASLAAAMLLLAVVVGGVGATAREARIAKGNRERAEKRFRDVRQLADTLVFEIHDSIQNVPGATPARKLLLDRALQYLDGLSKDTAGDVDLQRELAWGYQRLAVVQGSPTESNLGDRGAALASTRKATALFESVARSRSGDLIDRLNVAMGHRILAFYLAQEPSGREELARAMRITERLMAEDDRNPKVKSERSVEFQNLAIIEDAAGNRARALDFYRQDLSLKEHLLQNNPDYPRIQLSSGMATLMVSDELSRLGLYQEALELNRVADERYSRERGQPDDLQIRRERAIAWMKRGDLQLIGGDFTAAHEAYSDARNAIEPPAVADPQNQMLQLDLAALAYEDGRLFVLGGKYDAAITSFERALDILRANHTVVRGVGDLPHDVGAVYIWLGDADLALARRDRALDDFRKVQEVLGDYAASDDDVRCELATASLKAGDVLSASGRREEARQAYEAALALVDRALDVERRDVPAQLVAAEAYGALGDLLAAVGAPASHSADEKRPSNDIQALRRRSAELWRQIPTRSTISPLGFLSRRSSVVRGVAADSANRLAEKR